MLSGEPYAQIEGTIVTVETPEAGEIHEDFRCLVPADRFQVASAGGIARLRDPG